jgi:hypothetical protein
MKTDIKACGEYGLASHSMRHQKDRYAAETGHSQVSVISYSPNAIRQSGQSAFHMVLITSVHKLKLQISRHVEMIDCFFVRVACSCSL